VARLLLVTNLLGNDGRLAAVQGFTHEVELNGDDNILGVVPFLLSQIEGHDALLEESILTFESIDYVVKELGDAGIGNVTAKNFVAVRKIFADLIDNHVYETTSGTKSLSLLMDMILDGTPFTFSVVDSFGSQEFDNFGDDNSLALFQTLLTRYGAEFEIIGSQIILRQQLGTETDFQFRYGHNIKAINVKIDTSNLTTYVKGFGKPLTDSAGNPTGGYAVTGEYFSPNVALYGIRHAKPIRDDRVTTIGTLNTLMQQAVNDVPAMSIELDFVDLRAAGYPYSVPGLGDTVILVYEPMNNLVLDTRITKIATEYDVQMRPIRTKVTLANIRKDITDTLAQFSGTSKTVEKVFNADGSLVNNALPQAVQDATIAIQSAQTELEFINGIRAIDKTNPLLRVVLTAAGLGISDDGGVTYQTALTGEGLVADIITAGQLNANNVTILGSANFYWGAGGLYCVDSVNPDKFLLINEQGIRFTDDGGVSFNTAINADGVVADSLRSTGTIDVETDISVGRNVYLGEDWQDDEKSIIFNETAFITYNPLTRNLEIGSFNDVEFTSDVRFDQESRRSSPESGHCGIGGVDAAGTIGVVAGTYVQFQHKRYNVPSSITLTGTSSNTTATAIDITTDGFWLYVVGTGTAGTFKYWRGTYTTVD
jgi:phage minor structural protein